jgi:uncharacterized membrane protein (UPF0127 family)
MCCEPKGLFGKGLFVAMGLGVLACQEPKISAKQVAQAAAQEAVQATAQETVQEEDVMAEHYKMPPLPRTRLTLEGSFSRRAETFSVEVAHTPEATTRGLMWRKSLGPREGMLFDFGQEREQSFWMKNTLVSLDLVFISKEQTVVGIIERATPQSLHPLSVGLPSRYVLEILAGTCARMGVRVGSSVRWEAWQ